MLLILYFHSAFILVTKMLFNLLELFNGFNGLLSVRISTLSLGSVVGGNMLLLVLPMLFLLNMYYLFLLYY